jgi:hypothetical protein
MLLLTSQHPQRRRRSRPRSAAPAVGAQRRALTDDGAEGTPPRTLRGLVSLFSDGSPTGTSRFLYSNLSGPFFLSCFVFL